MNRLGLATVVATGFTAAIVGLAAPAQAATGRTAPSVVNSAIPIPVDFGHHAWVLEIQPDVSSTHR